MSRRLRPAEPIEVLDAETWEAPETLNDTDRRTYAGFDGLRPGAVYDEEEEK